MKKERHILMATVLSWYSFDQSGLAMKSLPEVSVIVLSSTLPLLRSSSGFLTLFSLVSAECMRLLLASRAASFPISGTSSARSPLLPLLPLAASLVRFSPIVPSTRLLLRSGVLSPPLPVHLLLFCDPPPVIWRPLPVDER